MFLHSTNDTPLPEDEEEAFPLLDHGVAAGDAEEVEEEEDDDNNDDHHHHLLHHEQHHQQEQCLEDEYDPQSLWAGPLTLPSFDFELQDNVEYHLISSSTTTTTTASPFKPSYAWVAKVGAEI